MKHTKLTKNLHAAWLCLAILVSVPAFAQVKTVKPPPPRLATVYGLAIKNSVVTIDDPNAPILHRLQGATYNQATHQFYPFYVNKNYIVEFPLNNIMTEGYVLPATGATTVDADGHIHTQVGPRKPVHIIEFWDLRLIVRKNGVDYKTIPFNTQGEWGDVLPPLNIAANLSGEGEYSFYKVQSFPDTAALRLKLTNICKFRYQGGPIDMNEVNQSVDQDMIKYKDLAGKTVYTLIAKFDPKRDFLIASLGDSFSSGEGNPLTCGTYETNGGGWGIFEDVISFGDKIADGVVNTVQGSVEGIPKNLGVGLADAVLSNPLLTSALGECAACKLTITNHTGIASCDFHTQPDWMEPGAHRSYRSGIALSAFQLERNHYGLATTFLSFATSGAKAANLYLTQQHPSWQDRSQLDELVRAAGSRRVDALVLSAGGNDAGFSDVLTKLATGHWEDFLAWMDNTTRAQQRARIEAAIVGLKQQYADMDTKIRRTLNVGKIYILEYPIPLFSQVVNGQIVDGPSCGMLSQGIFKIDAGDAAFIREMGNKLNAAVKEAAQEHGWVYVGGIAAAFDGHGYCSRDPYYEGAETSCNCQGNTNGILHPNAKGQDVLKTLLMKAIEKDYNFDSSVVTSVPR